jgi:hypothetical protein
VIQKNKFESFKASHPSLNQLTNDFRCTALDRFLAIAGGLLTAVIALVPAVLVVSLPEKIVILSPLMASLPVLNSPL